MSRAPRHSRFRPAGVLLALLASGCEERPRALAWELVFEDEVLRTRAAVVEGRVLEGGCSGEATLYSAEAIPGETPPRPLALRPGVYGLAGRARDAECLWFAAGCREVDLPMERGETVVVLLRGTSEQPACEPARCREGQCREGDADGDADVDADPDSGPDADADETPDGGCRGEDDCGECETCDDGVCVRAGEGAECAGGTCRDGACCRGCWDGSLCRAGDDDLVCGDQGGACVSCACPTPACVANRCAPRGVTSFGLGTQHACAVVSDGTLWCWGDNSSGQLGLGTSGPVGVPEPARVGTGEDWVQVSPGDLHTCGIRAGGELYCWGVNSDGQLGLGDLTGRNQPTRVGTASWYRVFGARRGDTTCAIASDRTLWCWGQNDYGQVGVAPSGVLNTPRQASSSTWASLSVGHHHACGIATDGVLHCWGRNSVGELGQGNIAAHVGLVRVGSDNDWLAVGAFGSGACAIKTDGSLWCWGANSVGQLGLGDTTERYEPERVGEASSWDHVAGGEFHVGARRSDGTLWFWGENSSGELGLGTVASHVASPTRVGLDTDWSELGLGQRFSCATRAGFGLWCFGLGTFGRLGLGDSESRRAPASVCLP